MKKNETNRNKLTPAEIQKFKAMLLAKLSEILANVTSMETEALRRERSNLSNMPTHMADLGTDNYEIENIIGLMGSERKIISEIYDALRRIEDGTYGICENRDEKIPRQRLKAIPWARYCVACATLLEKGLLVKKKYEEYNGTFPDDSSDDD
jgi:RNA polymerase-binding protein DksA